MRFPKNPCACGWAYGGRKCRSVPEDLANGYVHTPLGWGSKLQAKNMLRRCTAVICAGPGHASRFRCDAVGPHRQHRNEERGYFWSRDGQSTDFFDDSPEEQRF